MKELLQYILTQLVSEPDKIEIEEKVKGDQIDYVVHTAEKDLGAVIGRGGKVANSIRTVVRCKAKKDKCKVNIRFE